MTSVITLGRFRSVAKTGVLNWYPGHMVSAARNIDDICRKHTDLKLIIEVRDARCPFSSANTDFLAKLPPRVQSVVALTRADLADIKKTSQAVKYIKSREECSGRRRKASAIAIDARGNTAWSRRTVRDLLLQAARLCGGGEALVVGMPNLGKSTLINSMREVGKQLARQHQREDQNRLSKGIDIPTKFTRDINRPLGKRAKVGAKPGVTREVSAHSITVSVDGSLKRIMLHDSPGMMVPSVVDPSIGLKLALIGSLRDELVGEVLIAEYLLHSLNCIAGVGETSEAMLADLKDFVESSGQLLSADDIAGILLPCHSSLSFPELNGRPLYGKSLGLKRPMFTVEGLLGYIIRSTGTNNNVSAARKFIRQFRTGEFGRITLDVLPPRFSLE